MDSALPLTRRSLLAAGGVGALTLAAGGLLTRGEPMRIASGGLLRPEVGPVRSAFTPHVGSAFTLRAEDGRRVRTQLVEVSDLLRGQPDDEDAFALLLHASAGERMPQTVAWLEHPRVKTSVPLLVSPAGTGRRGQDYSITVNRRHPPNV